MTHWETGIRFASLFGAVCFVIGLHLMNSPATARRGNQVSAFGMVVAVAAVLLNVGHGDSAAAMNTTRWIVLLAGVAVGGAWGLYAARTVKMTSMPQLVSLFNAVGGGAAALIAIAEYDIHTHPTGGAATATVLDVVIGGVTFTGSVLAALKLQGHLSHPVSFPGSRAASVLVAAGAAAASGWVIAGADRNAKGAGEGGYARALTDEEQLAQQHELAGHIAKHDIVITTAHVPGRRPPLMVTSGAIAAMRRGSVIVDMGASALGGNVEGSQAGAVRVTANGVTIVGAGDLPSRMASASSAAYARNISALLLHLVADGALTIDPADEITAGVLVTHNGAVVHPATTALLSKET